MTVVHSFKGYGEHDYGSLPYGGGTAEGAMGFQFEAQIVDKNVAKGLQFEGKLNATNDSRGCQFEGFVKDKKSSIGLQFSSSVLDSKKVSTFQFISLINKQVSLGFELFGSNMAFIDCSGYGSTPYGSTPYGKPTICAALGMQFRADVLARPVSQGVQFEGRIDTKKHAGIQYQGLIKDFKRSSGLQFQSNVLAFKRASGVQAQVQITNKLKTSGLQFLGKIVDFKKPLGFEFQSVASFPLGLQFIVTLYNTNRLRILFEFPSRGTTGNNWSASSTKAGDFNPNNLNTDIVEQIWRSDDSVVTGVNVDADTEITQGVFLDTFAILNHNFTTSATVNLIGSNSSSFSPVGKTIPLNVRPTNIFHIEPDIPLESFRYWRIAIDDGTNSNGFLSMGTVIFGTAIIFQGECLVDQIVKKIRHFADGVRTEGFSFQKNDRSLKTSIRMEFKSLDFNKGNFKALSQIFNVARTSQKCLWIPTPSLTDPTFMERFAVFAKMVDLPEQVHNVKGPDLDFVDLSIELDEAE